jgi:multidrug efflux pump subunit AcrB
LQQAYMTVLTPLIRSASKRNITFLVVLALLGGAMLMPAWQFIRPAGLNGPLSMLGVELKMLPNDNTNTLLLQVDMPAGTALAATDQVARAVGGVVGRHPHVTDYQTFLGMTAPIDFAALVRGDMIKRGGNLAQLRVNLVDKHHRDDSSHEIADQLNKALMDVRKAFPTAKLKLYETPPGPPVQAQILAELYGPDYDVLRAAANHVDQAFAGIYGMINVDDSVTANADSFHVRVDSEKALLSGVAPGQVAKLLRDYVSGFAIGTLHVDNAREPIDIKVRLPRELRAGPETLMNLRITNPHGMQVPLSAIARVEKVTEAKPIYARDQHPMVIVGGELLQSSPVFAVLALDQMLDGKALPEWREIHHRQPGLHPGQPQGRGGLHPAVGRRDAPDPGRVPDLGSAFIVALILIYLMLVGYYKSFMLPVIVMGAIPLTLVGVFPGHWATSQAFTATSMIGVIALAGIVVRNSLLLIDFILDYRKQGYDLEQGRDRGRRRALPAHPADRPGHHPGFRHHDHRSGVRRPGGVPDLRYLRLHRADPGGHPADVLPVAA